MIRAVATLALLAVVATSASAGWRETFNIWERGYITCPVHGTIDQSDSLEVTPPIIAGDTLDVRGFMVGVRSADDDIGRGYCLGVRYRQAGDDGARRWNQWLDNGGAGNEFGMPLIGEWFAGVAPSAYWSMALSDFMPLANVRMMRLINPSVVSSMQTVTIWFLDQQDAKGADWSAWTMP